MQAQQGAGSEEDEISVLGLGLGHILKKFGNTAPIFKLADVAQLYMSRMQQFGPIPSNW